MLACRSNTAPGSREGESKAGGQTGKQQSVSQKEQTQQTCGGFLFFPSWTCNVNRAGNIKVSSTKLQISIFFPCFYFKSQTDLCF